MLPLKISSLRYLMMPCLRLQKDIDLLLRSSRYATLDQTCGVKFATIQFTTSEKHSNAIPPLHHGGGDIRRLVCL